MDGVLERTLTVNLDLGLNLVDNHLCHLLSTYVMLNIMHILFVSSQ